VCDGRADESSLASISDLTHLCVSIGDAPSDASVRAAGHPPVAAAFLGGLIAASSLAVSVGLLAVKAASANR